MPWIMYVEIYVLCGNTYSTYNNWLTAVIYFKLFNETTLSLCHTMALHSMFLVISESRDKKVVLVLAYGIMTPISDWFILIMCRQLSCPLTKTSDIPLTYNTWNAITRDI